MELRRVDAAPDPVDLHGAAGGCREQHGIGGEALGRLLVPDERVESPGQHADERVVGACIGEHDLDGRRLFAVQCADRPAEHAGERPRCRST